MLDSLKDQLAMTLTEKSGKQVVYQVVSDEGMH